MYIPKPFQQNDLQVLLDLVRNNNFGVLVSTRGQMPYASHIPFLVEHSETEGVILRGHVARANPHWENFAKGQSLAIFRGSHSYISPTWYQTTGVPTWNYTAVHITGAVTLVEDTSQLIDIVHQLSAIHEADNPNPWVPEYPDSMLSAIVGFELRADTVEGKIKMSQNRSAEDRSSVIQALRAPFGAEPDQEQSRTQSLMQQLEYQKQTGRG